MSASDPIDVAPGVRVPASAIEVAFVRSSGPGGQNVNKVSSKVELHVDLGAVTGLDAGAVARLERAAANRRDAEGRLLLTSDRFRDQPRNLDDARDKVRALIAAALVAPKRRRATRPSRGAVERRLSDKKRDSRKKQERRDRHD